MNVKYMFSLVAVILLFLLAYLGVEAAGLQVLFGIVIPFNPFSTGKSHSHSPCESAEGRVGGSLGRCRDG